MMACDRLVNRVRESIGDIRHSLIGLDERDRWRSALAGIAHGFGHTWDSCHAFSLTTHLPTYLYLAECPEGRVVCPLIERRFLGERRRCDAVRILGIRRPRPIARDSTSNGVPSPRARGGFARMSARIRFSARTASGPRAPSSRPRISTGFESTISDGLHRRLSRLRRRQLRRWRVPGWLCTDRDVLLRFVLESADGFFQRVGAAPNYFLSEATWQALAASDRVELLGALREGRLVAVTFFGWADGIADALFNISLPEGRDAATALLIEGAERLGTRGISLLNIGGGVRSGDDVERAKQLFGASARPLLHLKQVFAPGRFERLCAAAGAEASGQTTFFPPYHSPAHD